MGHIVAQTKAGSVCKECWWNATCSTAPAPGTQKAFNCNHFFKSSKEMNEALTSEVPCVLSELGWVTILMVYICLLGK